MEDPTARLVGELSSFLDEPTILSICSDFHLNDPEQFQTAREILLSISRDVEAEEATGFNPSGIGADELVDINKLNLDDADETAAAVNESDVKSSDGLTTTTDSSQAQSLFSASSSKASTIDASETFRVGVFDGLRDAEKEEQLLSMFTSLKPVDVRLALKKTKGDASLAIDHLLNIEWLEQTGQRVKGVDGFYTPDETAPQRKRKGKKKKAGVRASESKGSSPSSPVDSEDGAGLNVASLDTELHHAQNIAYLSERFTQPESDVSAIYYNRGESMGASVIQIVDNYLALGIQPVFGPQLSAFEEQLKKQYSWIPVEYFPPIIELTPTRGYAEDVVGILASYFEKPEYLKYDISYSVASSAADGELLSSNGVIDLRAKPAASSGSTTPVTGSFPTNLKSATASVQNWTAMRDHSYNSAAAAFRKGRSDPMFRLAAGYYAERAREQASAQRNAASIEAGYLVEQSSTADKIDLHGLTVQDGVNIALQYVRRWWERLGEDKARKARDGFTVVTGIGRHNSDGKSRLRTNVCKALLADGWKVEVLTGQFLVTGRKR
ncbi:smr domain-containing protein [Apiospora marii]|uniref:Smr domain-containing protein n=1 Tax=Apiospora marii TaxID=335849 RepID=A0ABR1RYS9_9PEZI